jgi:hypothetical protein
LPAGIASLVPDGFGALAIGDVSVGLRDRCCGLADRGTGIEARLRQPRKDGHIARRDLLGNDVRNDPAFT